MNVEGRDKEKEREKQVRKTERKRSVGELLHCEAAM